jgi:hypothetical protein
MTVQQRTQQDNLGPYLLGLLAGQGRYFPMGGVLRRKQSFLLRLPNSLREQATQIALEEGTSLNYFIILALAEKISSMQQSRSEVTSRSASSNPLQIRH